MRYLLPALLLCLLAGTSGCDKDDQPDGESAALGDLSVTVMTPFGENLRGVDITTVPGDFGGETDRFGNLLLRELPVGSYEVFAEASGVEQKANARVSEGELTETRFVMDVVLPPAVSIELLETPAARAYAPDETIRFTLGTAAVDHAAAELRVEVARDGGAVFASGLTPATDGVLAYETTLPRGYHTVSFTASAPTGETASVSVTVDVTARGSITLADLVVDDEGVVTLRWSGITPPDFPGYVIERGTDGCSSTSGYYSWTALDTLYDAAETDYVVTDAAPLAQEVCYRVATLREGDYRFDPIVSNVVSYRPALEGALDFIPTQLLAHPTDADVVYLVDAGLERVIRYDVDAGEATATAQLSGSLGRPDIAEVDGEIEVYVPSANGNVFVLDADDLSRELVISTTDEATSVAAFDEGFVLVSVSGGRDASYRTYDRATGALIHGGDNWRAYQGEVRRVPGKLGAVAISRGISPASSYHFAFDADGEQTAFTEDRYHGDFSMSTAPFEAAPNGEYFVTSSAANVVTANAQLSHRGALDHSGDQIGSVAFSADGTEIYCGLRGGGRFGDDPLTGIMVTTYPSRLRDRLISTRGYVYLVRRLADGRLLTIQAAEPPSYFNDPVEGPVFASVIEP